MQCIFLLGILDCGENRIPPLYKVLGGQIRPETDPQIDLDSSHTEIVRLQGGSLHTGSLPHLLADAAEQPANALTPAFRQASHHMDQTRFGLIVAYNGN